LVPVYLNVKVVMQPASWVTPSRSQLHVSPVPVEADPSSVTGEPVTGALGEILAIVTGAGDGLGVGEGVGIGLGVGEGVGVGLAAVSSRNQGCGVANTSARSAGLAALVVNGYGPVGSPMRNSTRMKLSAGFL
jgi:hypothetical protein